MKDLQKWIRIRKDLYRQMEAQVKVRLGGEDLELSRYRKDYEREFNKKWQPSTREKLFERIKQSRVVLMGDFHALQQSQKTHLRILKNFSSEKPSVLCLECFEANDQYLLDQFMAGKLSEKDFLGKVEWNTKWGFPFDHIRPLLRWAQSKKVPVFGINKPTKKRTAASLKSRDQFAAGHLQSIMKRFPDAVIFAIYGDLHLAKSHIPEELHRRAGKELNGKVFRLFQNSEKIYFQLLEQEIESTVDVVALGKDSYCLLNVPPWVKWQNYLMYLEQTYDPGLEDEDVEDSNPVDYTDHISAYVRIISEDLGQPLSCDDLSVYTARDANLWAKLEPHFNSKELTGIEDLIEEETSFYLPNLGVGYLARPTVNHAATLAAKYVHAKLSRRDRSFVLLPSAFLHLIWEEAIAYFGSKIINHKRKTDTVADLRLALTSRGSTQFAKEPLMLALSQKMSELMIISQRKPVSADSAFSSMRAKRKSSYLIAAKLLGGMLGERLYSAYQKKIISKSTVMSFIKKSTVDENFKATYYEMLEVIESLPAPFRSKKERL